MEMTVRKGMWSFTTTGGRGEQRREKGEGGKPGVNGCSAVAGSQSTPVRLHGSQQTSDTDFGRMCDTSCAPALGNCSVQNAEPRNAAC